MLFLQANETLQLVLGAATSTDIIAEVGGVVVQRNEVTASTFQLAVGPGQLTRLIVVAIGGAQTVTLKKSVTGNRTYQVTPDIALASGYALYYDAVNGLRVMDTSGRIRFSTA